MEQILGKNCNQIFSGALYRVKKDQGHLITSVFGIRGTVPGTKSSGALWILLLHPNSGHGRETQNIGWGARDKNEKCSGNLRQQENLWRQCLSCFLTSLLFPPHNSS